MLLRTGQLREGGRGSYPDQHFHALDLLFEILVIEFLHEPCADGRFHLRLELIDELLSRRREVPLERLEILLVPDTLVFPVGMFERSRGVFLNFLTL